MFLIILIFVLLIVYLLLVKSIHDLSIPTKSFLSLKVHGKEKTNVLVIYPHPDDELMSGGLIQILGNSKDFKVFMVSTTKGEHGDEILKLPPKELALVRSIEYSKVAKTLGVKNFELWNFTDGNMPSEENELKNKILDFISQNKIDLIVSYEKFGMYGHPDHIALSKVISQVSDSLKIKAIYATFPKKILKRINLPKTLTYKDRVVELKLDSISKPEFKINVTFKSLKTYLAGKHYKSQSRGSTIEQLMFALFGNFEYYTTKYDELMFKSK